MAVQIKVDEMNGCLSYFDWMMDNICSDSGECNGEGIGKCTVKRTVNGSEKCARDSIVESCRVMFETDFICYPGNEDTIKNDEIRAKDAMELRHRYAEEVGKNANKTKIEIDRIWKSVHGNCSVLELILMLCVRLDEMVNEEESGSMVGLFFNILTTNLGFISCKMANSEEEKSRQNGEIAQTKECADDRNAIILAGIDRFLMRKYNADGTGGGLFPLKKWSSERGSKDQREVPIWLQMNAWLSEHLDEDEHFLVENSKLEGVF